MSELSKFLPLRLILPGWPTSIMAIPPQIDQIGLAEFKATSISYSSLIASGTLQILQEIVIDLPLIPGLSLAMLNKGDFTEFGFDLEYFGYRFNVVLKA